MAHDSRVVDQAFVLANTLPPTQCPLMGSLHLLSVAPCGGRWEGWRSYASQRGSSQHPLEKKSWTIEDRETAFERAQCHGKQNWEGRRLNQPTSHFTQANHCPEQKLCCNGMDLEYRVGGSSPDSSTQVRFLSHFQPHSFGLFNDNISLLCQILQSSNIR